MTAELVLGLALLAAGAWGVFRAGWAPCLMCARRQRFAGLLCYACRRWVGL